MTTNTLFMLCGPPGCGKSTKAKELKAKYPDAIYISSDEFVERYARWCGISYNDAFFKAVKRASKRVTKLIKLAKEKDVIWDQTNLTQAERRARQLNFPNHNYVLHYCPQLNLSYLLDKNKTRDRGAMRREVIIKMHELYEYPDSFELEDMWHESYVIARTD